MLWFIVGTWLLSAASASVAGNRNPAIVTTTGELHGRWSSTAPDVAEFLGVRYATVARRFDPPASVDYDKPFVNATQFGPSCPRRTSIVHNPIMFTPVGAKYAHLLSGEGETFDEDCLTLNIWMRFKAPKSSIKGPAGILVWLVDSPENPMTQGQFLASHFMTVITVSYRHSVFGFPAASGLAQQNVGMLDISMAISWVRDNARRFRGAERIVLGGHGLNANAAIMYSHLYGHYPQAGFVDGIIADSPIGFQGDSTKTLAMNGFKKLSVLVGCTKEEKLFRKQSALNSTLNRLKSREEKPQESPSSGDSESSMTYLEPEEAAAEEATSDETIIECMRIKDWKELMAGVQHLTLPGFVPALGDGYFLPVSEDCKEDSWCSASWISSPNVQLLIGSSRNATTMLGAIYLDYKEFKEHVSKSLHTTFPEYFSQYLSFAESPDPHMRYNLVKDEALWFDDFIDVCNAQINAVEFYKNGRSVWLYNYQGGANDAGKGEEGTIEADFANLKAFPKPFPLAWFGSNLPVIFNTSEIISEIPTDTRQLEVGNFFRKLYECFATASDMYKENCRGLGLKKYQAELTTNGYVGYGENVIHIAPPRLVKSPQLAAVDNVPVYTIEQTMKKTGECADSLAFGGFLLYAAGLNDG